VFAFRPDPLAIIDVLPWLFALIVAVVAVVAAAYFLRFLRHWQVGDPDNEQTLRARFRELHQQGLLSFEEYREIQITLAEQMRQHAEAAERDK
jgi:phosphoglycerol transferase MdoB-like AlkP superfamily enzyme